MRQPSHLVTAQKSLSGAGMSAANWPESALPEGGRRLPYAAGHPSWVRAQVAKGPCKVAAADRGADVGGDIADVHTGGKRPRPRDH